MTEKSIIIEKIQRLLALSHSKNENEAHTALLKAQELLIKHKLSMREIENYDSSGESVDTIYTGITWKKAKWKAALSSLIAENTGCRAFTITYKSNQVVFIGLLDDVASCEIIYKYALGYVEENVKRLQRAYRKYNLSTVGLETEYAIGFITGLKEKYEEQLRENTTYALVLKENPILTSYIELLNVTKTQDITIKNRRNHRAVYEKGIEDGKSFTMQDKLAGDVYVEEL